jgi:hypothetical protein
MDHNIFIGLMASELLWAGGADALYLLKPHCCVSSCVRLGGYCPRTGLAPKWLSRPCYGSAHLMRAVVILSSVMWVVARGWAIFGDSQEWVVAVHRDRRRGQ